MLNIPNELSYEQGIKLIKDFVKNDLEIKLQKEKEEWEL